MNRPPVTKTSKPATAKPGPLPPARGPGFDPGADQAATKILDGASDTAAPAEDVDETVPETRDLCRPHRPTDVAYQFTFRTLHPLMDAAPRALLDAAVAGGRLRIACTPLVEVGLTYVADLRFLQVWRLIETCVGDLSAVVALAPGEQTTLSIKQTQRTSFTRQEVDSSESMTNLENTQIDKDVLNVARSTTKANQWRVDSTASISLGEVGSLSVSAGYSESTSNTTSRALERITEATQKSAQQLKNLQKTEVTQTHEVTEEAFARRRIKNPYRDRSLMLNVFDLYKRFEVTTGLAEIRPSLALEIPSMAFDRAFVLENADFLQAELLDSSVIEELRAALQTVQRPMDAVDETDTRRLATSALQYLFFEPVVVGDGTVHVNWSIDESLNGMGNALDDAVGNHLGVEFTTLVFFKRFYERMPAAERERWAIRIAVTLAEAIGPGWTAGDQGHIANVLDRHNPTEVMRRLSGFLALVDKIIKPLLIAPEDARMARDSSERAEFVITRVVKHLGCYQDYYVQRWLEYVYRRSDRLTLIRLLHDTLLATGRLDLLRNFDPAEAFLEGNRFIVPARKRIGLGDSVKWGERMRGNAGFESGLPAPRTTVAVVPTDGVHIEPRAGGCVLDDLPPAAVNVSTKLEISAQADDATEPAADDTETDADTDG